MVVVPETVVVAPAAKKSFAPGVVAVRLFATERALWKVVEAVVKIVTLVDEAAEVKVLVPAPERARREKVLLPVRVPAIVCAVAPEKVVVPEPAVKVPLFV